MIRGPGIGKNEIQSLPSGHVDMAPTVLDMAGIAPKDEWQLDGKAIAFKEDDDVSDDDSEHTAVEYWGTFAQEGKYKCK